MFGEEGHMCKSCYTHSQLSTDIQRCARGTATHTSLAFGSALRRRVDCGRLVEDVEFRRGVL